MPILVLEYWSSRMAWTRSGLKESAYSLSPLPNNRRSPTITYQHPGPTRGGRICWYCSLLYGKETLALSLSLSLSLSCSHLDLSHILNIASCGSQRTALSCLPRAWQLRQRLAADEAHTGALGPRAQGAGALLGADAQKLRDALSQEQACQCAGALALALRHLY